MTELRQKMIRAMELKNLSPHTQRAYLAAVKGLVRHYRQSPCVISKEMIEDYLQTLKKPEPPTAAAWCSPDCVFSTPTWPKKNCRWITACVKKPKGCPPCSPKRKSQKSSAHVTISNTG